MDYYQCTKADLHRDLTRRGFQAYGDQDEAAERLESDDNQRGAIATEVSTAPGLSNEVYTWRCSNEYGKTVVASLLVGESELHLVFSSLSHAQQQT